MAAAESWSIGELARLSGVTARTLRHYQAIGLLAPAWTGPGGLRHYREPELLRLQQILTFRELGLGLPAVAAVLDGGREPVELLREHRTRLLAERERLGVLAETVRKTINHLTEGDTMSAEEMFAGYDPAKQEQYEQEIRERYGDEVVEESKRTAARWKSEGRSPGWERFDTLGLALVGQIEAGLPAGDGRTQELIGQWYEVVAQAWTPNSESFAGLGRLYVDSPDFKATFDAKHAGLAEYLCEAMGVYAEQQLN